MDKNKSFLTNIQDPSVTRRLRRFRRLGLIPGIIVCLGYIALDVLLVVYNNQSGGFAWVLGLMLAWPVLIIYIICVVLAAISIVGQLMLMFKHRRHNVKNYASIMATVLLMVSPFISSAIVVGMRREIAISDPFYHYSSGGADCERKYPVEEERFWYDFPDLLVCRALDFRNENDRQPTEAELYDIALEIDPDFNSRGLGIKVEYRARPNETDFVIFFGINCYGEEEYVDNGRLVFDYKPSATIFTPFYDSEFLGRTRECSNVGDIYYN